MATINEKYVHQSAKKLLETFSYVPLITADCDIRKSQASDISPSEFEEDGYLFSKYIDELFRGLTKDNYDKWKFDTLQRNAILKTYVCQKGIFANERDRIINILCSEKLSLLKYSKNVEETIIEPYGDISSRYESDDSLSKLEDSIDKSAVTNIVIMGRQMLPAAINAFLSSSREENSITYAIACDANNIESEFLLAEKFNILPAGPSRTITGKDYYDNDGKTVVYVKKWTGRAKRNSVF